MLFCPNRKPVFSLLSLGPHEPGSLMRVKICEQLPQEQPEGVTPKGQHTGIPTCCLFVVASSAYKTWDNKTYTGLEANSIVIKEV